MSGTSALITGFRNVSPALISIGNNKSNKAKIFFIFYGILCSMVFCFELDDYFVVAKLIRFLQSRIVASFKSFFFSLRSISIRLIFIKISIVAVIPW